MSRVLLRRAGLDGDRKAARAGKSGGIWLEVGAHQVHLGAEQEFRPARKAHPAFTVADLEALAARLNAAGVRTTFDDAIPGTRRFYADDPVGNRLEFIAEA